jgi:hypothetical protein
MNEQLVKIMNESPNCARFGLFAGAHATAQADHARETSTHASAVYRERNQICRNQTCLESLLFPFRTVYAAWHSLIIAKQAAF